MRGISNPVVCMGADGSRIEFDSMKACARHLKCTTACVQYALRHGNMITRAKCKPCCIDSPIDEKENE